MYIKKKITLNFDINFKDYEDDFIFSDIKNEDWIKFNGIVTHYRNIKVLDKTDELAIIYFKVIIPEGVKDTQSDKIQREIFLFISDKEGSRKYSVDIELPYNSRFLNYEDGILTLYEKIGNYIDIVKYKIEIE